MGALDSAMQGLAVTLVDTLGTEADVELNRVSGYDPTTRRGTVSGESVTVKAVIGSYRADQIQGQVHASDLPVWVPALEVDEPKPGDLLTFGGTRYRVITVNAHYAGALPALYECQVRA